MKYLQHLVRVSSLVFLLAFYSVGTPNAQGTQRTHGLQPPFVSGDENGSDDTKCLVYDTNHNCISKEYSSCTEGPWIVGGAGRPRTPYVQTTNTCSQGVLLAPTTSGLVNPLLAFGMWAPNFQGNLFPGETPNIPTPWKVGTTYAVSSVGYGVDPVQLKKDDHFADWAAVAMWTGSNYGGGAGFPCPDNASYNCFQPGYEDINIVHTSSPYYDGAFVPGEPVLVTRQGTPGGVGVPGGEAAVIGEVGHGIVRTQHNLPDGSTTEMWQHEGIYPMLYLVHHDAWDRHDNNFSVWTGDMADRNNNPCEMFMAGGLGPVVGSSEVLQESQSEAFNLAPAAIKATGGPGNSIFDVPSPAGVSLSQLAGDCVANKSIMTHPIPRVSFPMNQYYTDPNSGMQLTSYYDQDGNRTYPDNIVAQYETLMERIFQWEDSCPQQETSQGLNLSVPCTDSSGNSQTWTQAIQAGIGTRHPWQNYLISVGLAAPVGHPEQAYIQVLENNVQIANETSAIMAAKVPNSGSETVQQSLSNYWHLTLTVANSADEVTRLTGLNVKIPTDGYCDQNDILCSIDYLIDGAWLPSSYISTVQGWFNNYEGGYTTEQLQQTGVIIVNDVALTPPPGPVNPYTGGSLGDGSIPGDPGGCCATPIGTFGGNGLDGANGAPVD